MNSTPKFGISGLDRIGLFAPDPNIKTTDELPSSDNVKERGYSYKITDHVAKLKQENDAAKAKQNQDKKNSDRSNSESGSDSDSSQTGSSSSGQSGSSGSDSQSDVDKSSPKKALVYTSESQDVVYGTDKKLSGRRKSDDIRQNWDNDPELWGVRRSGRPRKEPTRLSINIGKSDESDDAFTSSKSRKGSKFQTKKNDGAWNNSDDDSSVDSSDSEELVKPTRRARPTSSRTSSSKKQQSRSNKDRPSRGRPKKKPLSSEEETDSSDDGRNRFGTLRNTSKGVSYKEDQSDQATDPDDVVEVATVTAEVYNADAESIEKVIDRRKKKKVPTATLR